MYIRFVRRTFRRDMEVDEEDDEEEEEDSALWHYNTTESAMDDKTYCERIVSALLTVGLGEKLVSFISLLKPCT